MDKITVDPKLSHYRSDREFVLVLSIFFIPGCAGISALMVRDNWPNPLVAVSFATVCALGLVYLGWWGFGPRFTALQRQNKEVVVANNHVRNHWFEISSQRWIVTPVVDRYGVAKMQDCWYATFRANGSELAVMWEKEWVEKHGLTEGKAPTHIKFPHARYNDNGELVLDATYGFFSLKY